MESLLQKRARRKIHRHKKSRVKRSNRTGKLGCDPVSGKRSLRRRRSFSERFYQKLFCVVVLAAMSGVGTAIFYKDFLLVCVKIDLKIRDLLEIRHVKAVGVVNSDYAGIIATALSYKSLWRLRLPYLQKKIQSMDFVQGVHIKRVLPNSVVINVTEYNPIAVYKGRLISSEGDYISGSAVDFEYLPEISGDNANHNLVSLFSVLRLDGDWTDLVKSAEWVGDRRWDIVLKNGLMIKMPENEPTKAWALLLGIYNKDSVLQTNIKAIDLRVDDRIFIE